MRFETLHLERYGHFTGKSLDLGGADVLLHIVHGRNEAGKSTILSAIADLLFGFPTRSTFNFLHDYESLRVGGTIVSRTQEKLSFKRRKGNARTLRSDEDQVLPEGALVPFLGDADRSLFENMFGLDHTRLRAAGKRMMEADGDLGRSLFEAGSGLDGVDRVLAELQGEIDTIGTPERRSSRKPLWAAAESYAEAQKAKRDLALRHEEFQAAERALAQAIATKARINEDLASIRERRGRLERIRRAGRILIDIDRLVLELAAYADVPDLPASFDDQRREFAQMLLAAEHGADLAEAAHVAAAGELAAIPAGDTLTRFAPEITALQDRLGEYLKGVTDEPKLARDIARYDDEIARHTAVLDLGCDPAEAESRIPKKPLVARIGAAIRSGDTLRTKLGKARDDARQAETNLHAAEADLAKLDGTEDPALAISLVEAAAKYGDVVSAVVDFRREVIRASRDLDAAESRLACWTRGVEALAATRLPSPEAIRDHEEQLHELGSAMDAARQKRDEAEAEIRDIAAAISTLEAEGDIPTAEAVAAARDHRDALWRRVRTRALARPGPPEALDHDLMADYESSVVHADSLADRKATEAQRVARFGELSSRKDHCAGRAAAARTRLDQIEQSLDRLRSAWIETWAGVGMKADSPATMRAFLAAKDEALRCLEDKRRVDERLAGLLDHETRARGLFQAAARALDLEIDSAASFDALEQRVRAAAKAREAEWKKKLAFGDAVARERRALEARQSEVAGLEEALRAWTDDWSLLVTDLCCPGAAGPEEAVAVLDIWDRMRDPLTERGTALRRLEGLRVDLADFRSTARALAAEIARACRDCEEDFAFDESAEPEAIVRDLRLRLEEEVRRLGRREDLGKRRDAAKRAFEEAQSALVAARAAVSDLRRLHGLDDTADLAGLGRRAVEKRALVENLKKRREDLAKDGEGFDEDALREQCRSCSPDAAAAEVAALLTRESELVPDGQAAAQAETGARQALDALYAKTGAAEADAKGRDAALAFAGYAERWLLLETTRQLMLRAVERYRTLNEDPMISRASSLLARIAAGAENPIIRLGVEYRDGKAPEIVGWRSDGSSCEVKHMSEGTRDQLFLCLRIAAIELYAKEREPLPFIADDLFVTSDDARVVPGLAALAELGRTTQVILFTHHRHVVDAAATLPSGTIRVHELSALHELATADPVSARGLEKR